jgi:hypothetical protein
VAKVVDAASGEAGGAKRGMPLAGLEALEADVAASGRRKEKGRVHPRRMDVESV